MTSIRFLIESNLSNIRKPRRPNGERWVSNEDLEFTVNHHGRGCFLGRQNFIGCYFYDTEEFWWPNLVKSSWIRECFILKGWQSILWCNDVFNKNFYSCFPVIISTCRLSVQIVNVPLACFGKLSDIAVNSNEFLYSNNHRTSQTMNRNHQQTRKLLMAKQIIFSLPRLRRDF